MLAAVLCVYTAGASSLLFWDLRLELTRHAIQDIETVEGLLYFDPAGNLHFHDDYHNHPESKQIQERYLEVLPTMAECCSATTGWERSRSAGDFLGRRPRRLFARTERLATGRA